MPAHAAWSSAAFTTSLLAPWRRDLASLAVPGAGDGFCDLRLEERLPIPHGGGSPNLDGALEDGDGTLVGLEVKLTEHLAPRTPAQVTRWKPAYHRPAMARRLAPAWRAVFEDLRDGRWTPRHLDAGQLVRHALSLHDRPGARLVLLAWEPTDGDDHVEVRHHRAEAAELLERLGPDARPVLTVMRFDALLAAWSPVRPALVATLGERFAVAVGT